MLILSFNLLLEAYPNVGFLSSVLWAIGLFPFILYESLAQFTLN
jgi:hypothetical protein